MRKQKQGYWKNESWGEKEKEMFSKKNSSSIGAIKRKKNDLTKTKVKNQKSSLKKEKGTKIKWL